MKSIVLSALCSLLLTSNSFAQAEKAEFSKISLGFGIALTIAGVIVYKTTDKGGYGGDGTAALKGMITAGVGAAILLVEGVNYTVATISEDQKTALNRSYKHFEKIAKHQVKSNNILPIDEDYNIVLANVDCEDCSDKNKAQLLSEIFNKAKTIANKYKGQNKVDAQEIANKLNIESDVNRTIALSYVHSTLLLQ